MKTLFFLPLFCLLFSTETVCAQKVVPVEDINAYVQKINPYIERIQNAFVAFNESMGQGILSAKSSWNDFNDLTRNSKQELDEMEAMNNESWYLSEAQLFADLAFNMGQNQMRNAVLLLEQKENYYEYQLKEKFDDLYKQTNEQMQLGLEKMEWAKIYMIAKLHYAPQTTSFCTVSNKLVEEAKTKFVNIKGAPAVGKTNKFEVSIAPEGALSGEISEQPFGSSAKYLYIRSSNKAEVLQVFNTLVYWVIACSELGTEPEGQFIALDQITATNTPDFFLRPQDVETHGNYSIVVEMKMEDSFTAEKIWYVVLTYKDRKY